MRAVRRSVGGQFVIVSSLVSYFTDRFLLLLLSGFLSLVPVSVFPSGSLSVCLSVCAVDGVIRLE